MKRTIYLIDYENVHEAGLQGMESCPAGCAIHLFYSQNANRLSLDLLRGLKAAFFVHKVQPGRQSLDMQLVSYLGFLIGTEGPDCRYVIVSKDRDFANTPQFWQSEAGIEVVRQSTLDGLEPRTPAAAPAKRTSRSTRTASRTAAPAPAAETPAEPEEAPKTEALAKAPVSALAPAPAPVPAPAPAPAAEEVPDAGETPAPAEAQAPEAVPAEAPRPSGQSRQQRRTASRQAPAQPDRKTRLNNRLMQVLSENQVDNATTMKAVAVTIGHYSDKNIKQMTYRSIIKEFGQKRGLELYNLIKPVLEADARQK